MSTTTAKRIGILTGGGDCPGLNAVIRAVVKTAWNHYGATVIGIEDGFEGVVEGRMHEIQRKEASNILQSGRDDSRVFQCRRSLALPHGAG